MSVAPKHLRRSSEGAFERLGADLEQIRIEKAGRFPMPAPRQRRASPMLNALRSMKVGESIIAPDDIGDGSICSFYRGALPARFTRRGRRIWRIK